MRNVMWFKSYEHFHYLTTGGCTSAQQTLVYQKYGFACQWLDNVDMHVYTKFDHNIPCSSLTDHGRTHAHSDYSADPRVVQLSS